ncbi:MAG: hypothetical protein WBQ61_24500 [Candidatus Acidiferrum sp.]
MQSLCLQYRLKSVGRNANNLQAAIFAELLTDAGPPIGKIIYDKNTNKELITDVSSRSKFKTI